MQKSKYEKHLLIYRTLMVEIKDRMAVLDGALNNTFKMPDRARHELCHLQLRLTCELIAMSCLAAHGNIPATYSKGLLTTYQPGLILSELEKLHPDFYPRPCERTLKLKPEIEISILDDADDRFLKKVDLVGLHGKTGGILHMRRLKDITRPIKLDFKEIEIWRNKIVNLLAAHLIALNDEGHYVFVIMQDPNLGGAPSTTEIAMTYASPGWLAEKERRCTPKRR
jgi:hypothetical protein